MIKMIVCDSTWRIVSDEITSFLRKHWIVSWREDPGGRLSRPFATALLFFAISGSLYYSV